MNQQRWTFPPLGTLEPGEDLIAVGADLAPRTVLNAYSSGYFPMPIGRRLGWFSPDPRGVFSKGDLIVSRSLRRSLRRYQVTLNRAFALVIRACADPGRDNGWIDRRMIAAYEQLHELGSAHSVEVWLGEELVGGLYGIGIGGFFAGESMFYRETDASKVALVHLIEGMNLDQDVERLLDVQWMTPHLESLGGVAIPRSEYANRLQKALAMPQTNFFTESDSDEH